MKKLNLSKQEHDWAQQEILHKRLARRKHHKKNGYTRTA
jgi:hypothetical protein